jgi:inosine-uridine nucleoside N-ribohydrolase
MRILLPFLCMFLLVGCSQTPTANKTTIIFETDMGNDVDDALALDMIYKYLDDDKIDVLAISSNKDSRYSTEYIHLMNHWYGYPNIPLAKVVNGIDSENDARNYAKFVSLQTKPDDAPLFDRPAFDHDIVPEAVSLYRELLTKAKDNSVVLVSVGFSTNIYRLLQSAPDATSPLSGKELIKKKVKALSIMAGSLGENKIPEYNVKDIPAAQMIANEWPTEVIFTPFEAGIAVTYPAKSIENDFTWADYHPVVEAYKHYKEMPYDRPTWDLISLLYVVEKSPEFFDESPKGQMSVDDKGYTSFTENATGNHSYLTIDSLQAETVKSRFVELITAKPKNRKP